MKIPYDKFELQFAWAGLDEEVFTEEKMKELEKEIFDNIPSDKSSLNKKIAEFQGITVKDLIDSPNYKILCTEWAVDEGKKFVIKFIEKFNITEKEAWAMLAMATGLLD